MSLAYKLSILWELSSGIWGALKICTCSSLNWEVDSKTSAPTDGMEYALIELITSWLEVCIGFIDAIDQFYSLRSLPIIPLPIFSLARNFPLRPHQSVINFSSEIFNRCTINVRDTVLVKLFGILQNLSALGVREVFMPVCEKSLRRWTKCSQG